MDEAMNGVWNRWTLTDGRVLMLVTPDAFAEMPDGSVLWSIRGERVVKGQDYIDNDTRAGLLAYGTAQEPTEPEGGER